MYYGALEQGNVMEDDLLSAGQAAAALGMSRQRLDEIAHEGRIPRRKIGRTYVYRRADVDAYKTLPRLKPGPKSERRTQLVEAVPA